MVTNRQARVVLVTCGTRGEARRIAQAVVTAGLAACVNIISAPVESVYRWKGKVEKAREFLLVVKTSGKQLRELEKTVRRLHSYDVPEFLVLGVAGGSKGYLRWLLTESSSRAAGQ
ncbi:MAG TPA: divalent-cation tolerance protein CutA [Dongiaceae bacterium]|nr:divalent-cation tolerance protein CutA [Dongiaceae bacterium]